MTTPSGTKTLRGVALPKPPTAVEPYQDEIEALGETQVTHSEPMLPLSEVLALIDAKVAEAIAKAPRVDAAPVPQVPSLYEGKYLLHVRCNEKNLLSIRERRMTLDPVTNEYVPGEVIPGRKMVFVRGHFFATDENQVRQLEWMMKTPRFRAGVVGPNTVLGGRPGLWVDDGLDTIKIGEDRWVTRGSEAHKAHLRTLGQF
jgi:hypothetical protein